MLNNFNNIISVLINWIESHSQIVTCPILLPLEPSVKGSILLFCHFFSSLLLQMLNNFNNIISVLINCVESHSRIVIKKNFRNTTKSINYINFCIYKIVDVRFLRVGKKT